jgi:hypothetical protein
VKRAIVVALLVLTAVPSFADARAEKTELIAELLEVIDAKALTQASFDAIFTSMRGMNDAPVGEDIPEESRAQLEASRKAQEEQMRTFRERFYTRLDHVKYADQVYAPLFDEHFNVTELKELIAFFKTKAGQKMMKVIPDLGIAAMAKGQKLLESAAAETYDELRKEEAEKTPWKPTMADMRTIAAALEARATDTNEYPDASFAELEGLLHPTYINTLPTLDGWGTPFVYFGNREHYRIVSAGADRRFEWSTNQLDAVAEPRETDNLNADLVYQDGTFTQYPAVAKHQH